MNCKNCGAQLSNEARFCRNCGFKVENNNINNNQVNEGHINNNINKVNTQNNSNIPTYNNENNNNNTLLFVIIGILSVIIVALLIIFIPKVIKKDNDSSSTNNANNPITTTENKTSTTTKSNSQNTNSSYNNYSIIYSDFNLTIPNTVQYKSAYDSIELVDRNGTWDSNVRILKGDYHNADFSQIKASLVNKNFKVNSTLTKSVGGVSYTYFTASLGSEQVIFAFANVDTNHSIVIVLRADNNDYDNSLSIMSDIIKNAKLRTTSNNIKENDINLAEIIKNINIK